MVTDRTGNVGTILGVWGDPDEEAYVSAGLMARAVGAGHRVVCVTATRGEAGFPAADRRSVADRKALREKELADCLAILGVPEHHYLGFPDGGCGAVPDDEAVAAIAALIDEVQPDSVLTFGPDGGTGHQDHIAACRWTTIAFDRSAGRLQAAVLNENSTVGRPVPGRCRTQHDHDARQSRGRGCRSH